jgi:hypothetical protein
MEHMYRKVMGSSPPDEAKLVAVEILKATYGRGNNVHDVTLILRDMLAEQGVCLVCLVCVSCVVSCRVCVIRVGCSRVVMVQEGVGWLRSGTR